MPLANATRIDLSQRALWPGEGSQPPIVAQFCVQVRKIAIRITMTGITATNHFAIVTNVWSVEEQEACFVVSDANGQKPAYVYSEEEPGRQTAAKLLTKDEARRIAVNFARLPELLGSQPQWR